MRPILPGDLDQAARALLALPDAARGPAIGRWLADADLADRHRKHTGRAHPSHGDGSLLAVVMKQPRLPAAFCDPVYCAALALVLRALDDWHRRQIAGDLPFLRGAAPLSVPRSLGGRGQQHGDSETFPGRG